MKKVMSTLRKHGLYVKAEKCDFEKVSIQFLGLIISTEGIAMDPQKVKAILEWPAPLDKKGSKGLWALQIFTKDLWDFSVIITPITQVTRQHAQFQWSSEAQAAFDKLNVIHFSISVPKHPNPGRPYVLEVDASEVATGAILSKRQGPKALLHPIAFSSQKMSQPERNYDVRDRELLAIKTALEEWRYLHTPSWSSQITRTWGTLELPDV